MEPADIVDAMNGADRYLLLSPGRVGSVMLHSALNYHPSMRWRPEPFNAWPNVWGTLAERLDDAWGKPNTGMHYIPPGMWCPTVHDMAGTAVSDGVICNECLIDYASEQPLDSSLFDNRVPKTTGSAGPIWHQRSNVIARFLWPIVQQLADKGLRVIILGRQNLLARSVSAQFARQRKCWHVHNAGDVARSAQQRPIHINPALVSREAVAIRSQLAALEQAFPDALRIDYEQLAAEPQATFHLVQRFLGVEPRRLRSSTVKNDRAWQDRVSNYNELRDHLRDNPEFSPYFE